MGTDDRFVRTGRQGPPGRGERRMPRSRQGVGAAVAVLLSLLLLGCTGGRPGASRSDLQAGTGADTTTVGASPTTAAGQGGGGPSGGTVTSAAAASSGGATAPPPRSGSRVPGAPVGSGSRKNQPKALGAPIKVPRFQQIGAPIGEVFGSIEAEFVAACGGQLCVTLVIRPANADPETCGFAGTDPPARTTVQRDTTVALLCTPAPTDPGDTTPPDATTTPDATTPSDDSQPTISS